MEALGYEQNVVILTQPPDFVKKKNSMLPLIRARYRHYPEFVRAVATRHFRYNRALKYVHRQAKEGKAFIIQPDASLCIPNIEHDPDELQRVYDIGRRIGEEKLEEVQALLAKS